LIVKKQSTAFVAELKPSKTMRRLICVIHVMALAASFANALPLLPKIIVAAIVGLHFMQSYRALKTGSCTLRCNDKGGWELARNIVFEPVEIMGSTVITPCFIFLHLRDKPPLLIPHDAMDDKTFRLLIVKLKMTGH
jgi:hypothetical protein